MIDYLLKFADEASARSEAVLSGYLDAGAWVGDCVIPNVQCWNINNDVAGTDADGNATITHVFDAGWFITISEAADAPALRLHPSCVLAVDWSGPSLAAANPPAGTSVKDYRVSPVFAGRDPAALLAALP